MTAFDASSAAFFSSLPQVQVLEPVLEPDASLGAGAPGQPFSPESVSRIAHDLNNALATVIGYAQLLENQPDWPPHLARQLQNLAHDAARACALSNELLLLACPNPDAPLAAPPLNGAASTCAGASNASNGTYYAGTSPACANRAAVAGGLEILVVDDEEPVITLISEILTMDGYNVTPAFNGAEALAWTQMRNFDLIISDVRMPAVGGPAFYEILQTERPDLLRRVLFVTGDTVSFSTRHFLAGTKRPVLAKPFDPQRLLDMVRECLAA